LRVVEKVIAGLVVVVVVVLSGQETSGELFIRKVSLGSDLLRTRM
jgi:hypothetical protein